LVEVSAAPLNALDRAIAAGTHYSKPTQFPVVCGVTGVGRLPDGSRVMLAGVRAPFGTMAERAVVDPSRVFTLPDGIDDALAAAAFNPGMSAWQTLEWRAKLLKGERVLILGATGVTGQLAVQFARRLGAGEIVVAGRNRELLSQLRALGADALIELEQPEAQLEAAFRSAAGAQGFDVIVDYLWGRPLEILLRAITVHDLTTRGKRMRLVQVGEMAGSHISLPAGALRSTALEILGSGTGSAPPPDVLRRALPELLDGLARGELTMNIERIPLAEVSEHWHRDHRGRRLVFIP
jgi:NADPH2:quinone reductase